MGVPGYLARRFEMRPEGLFKKGDDDKGAQWISAPFAVEAETLEDDTQGWGLLIAWHDRNGGRREEVFSRDLFSGECGELRARLARGGLVMSNAQSARQAFAEYLSYCSSPERARSVLRVGWHQVGGQLVFVLPDEIFGNPVERVVLAAVDREASPFAVAGTLQQWQETVGRLCIGNSRLVFFASCGFAGPLLSLLNQPGGGVNVVGKAQTGKSTALRVLGSVCGGSVKDGAEGFWRSWRSTGNAMEGVAAMHNDTVLCLDEMGLVDAREAGEIAYMLANGQGKGRATRQGGARAVARWRILFCSTGEVTLADKNAEAGKRTQAGQEVRLVDIPADAGAGLGLFEDLHDEDGPAELARRLSVATAVCYGTPLRAFLRHLVLRLAPSSPAYIATLREHTDATARKLLTGMPGASGQVRSVATRFAVIAVAGELATEALVTGWAAGEATGAAEVCFRAYLAQRGTIGAREDAQAVRQLRAFISEHGAARFAIWRENQKSDVDSQESYANPPAEGYPTQKRAGWRRWMGLDNGQAGWRYYLTAEGLEEALVGLAKRDARRTLLDLGYLVVPNHLAEHAQRGVIGVPMAVPGHGKVRLFRVGDSILASHEGDF